MSEGKNRGNKIGISNFKDTVQLSKRYIILSPIKIKIRFGILTIASFYVVGLCAFCLVLVILVTPEWTIYKFCIADIPFDFQL